MPLIGLLILVLVKTEENYVWFDKEQEIITMRPALV